MNRVSRLSLCLCVISALAVAQAEDKPDACAKTKAQNGWCGEHKHGFFNGHEIKSEAVWKTLHGEKVDASAVKCDGCKKAIAENGYCEHCKVWVTDKVAYKSAIPAVLMRGAPIDASKLTCKGCIEAEKIDAFCGACQQGYLDHRVFKGEAYMPAKRAHDILEKSIEAIAACEGCAVAILTNGECSHCHLKFQNGQPSKT